MSKTLLQGPKFEAKDCAHCAGTRVRSGEPCPRCNGAGAFLTRRGRAARAYMNTLLVKPGAETVVGDVIWFPVGGVKVASAVLRVEHGVGSTERIRLYGLRRMKNEEIAFTVAAHGTVELAHTPQELEEVRLKVEAYQASLTKTGSVSRRRRLPSWSMRVA